MTRLTDSERDLAGRNLGLARMMAVKVWKLAHRIPDIDDLRQAAMIGLCDAAHHYNPAGGAKFSTYAARACYFSALSEAANNGLIGTPSWMNTTAKKGHPLIAKGYLARYPVQFRVDHHDSVDFDPQTLDDLHDTNLMLNKISGRDRMLVWHWMLGDTYVSIGKAFHMTDERAKQRIYRALKAIRQRFGGRTP